MIQFRPTDLAAVQHETLARQLVQRARISQVQFIVNNDIALAAKIGADGVHLGQGDGSVLDARRARIAKVGVTAQTCGEAQKAEADGADYIGVGPIYPSPTKPDKLPVGLNRLRQIRRCTRTKIAAIGGITPENAQDCLTAGADFVCAISSLFNTDNLEETARRFIQPCHPVPSANALWYGVAGVRT